MAPSTVAIVEEDEEREERLTEKSKDIEKMWSNETIWSNKLEEREMRKGWNMLSQ